MFLAATRRGAVACAHAAKRGTNEWKMKLLPVAQLAESAAKRDNCPSSSMLQKGGRGSAKPANIAGKNTALLIPNVSSRSMESGSSCCCCCSYACCAPVFFYVRTPLGHAVDVAIPLTHHPLFALVFAVAHRTRHFLSPLFGDLFILFSILPS